MGEERRGLLGHTAGTAAATVASRLLGYARDRAVASLLGTSYAADAFYIAFRIPNTFRRFVAEGAMTASLVPVLSGAFQEGPAERAWLLARRFLYVSALFLVLLGAVGVLASPWIVRAMAWELPGKAPEVFLLTERLTALLFPYITLVSLSAVAMGILNCRDSFAAPALAPAFMNVAIILAALVWGRHSGSPAYVLAFGVLAGGCLQLLWQFPFLKLAGMSFAPAFSLGDPGVRRILALMVPGMLGAGAGQLTVLVGTALAHTAGEGAVSALYYSNRLTELAYGIFAVSLSNVILPSMSRQAAAGDGPAVEATLGTSVAGVSFVLLPASAGLIALCGPIVRVLFRTGSFSERSVAITAGPLAAYACGLAAWGIVSLLVRACHAHQDMIAPFHAALAALAVFTLTALILIPPAGATGIAAASSLSALVQGAWLVAGLRRRHALAVPLALFAGPFLRCGALSAVMGLAVFGMFRLLPAEGLLVSALSLFGTILFGMALYLGGACLLRFPEAKPIVGLLRTRRMP